MAYEGKPRTDEELERYINSQGSRETVASFRGCCAKCKTPYNCANKICQCHRRTA